MYTHTHTYTYILFAHYSLFLFLQLLGFSSSNWSHIYCPWFIFHFKRVPCPSDIHSTQKGTSSISNYFLLARVYLIKWGWYGVDQYSRFCLFCNMSTETIILKFLSIFESCQGHNKTKQKFDTVMDWKRQRRHDD